MREPALREATSLPKLSFPPSPGTFDRSTALRESYPLPTEPQGFGLKHLSYEARRAMSIIPSRAGPL